MRGLKFFSLQKKKFDDFPIKILDYILEKIKNLSKWDGNGTEMGHKCV